jgi:hypothetical protein
MLKKLVFLFSVVMVFALASRSRGEKGAELKPTWAKIGKPVIQETFDGPKLGKSWVVNKGDFQIREGSLVGWEKKEDMHAAVLTLQKPFKNTAMRFSFKREGATGFNLSFNHPKGHLFRILINEEGLSINKDKDKKDANSKAQVLGKAEGKFPNGQWHTLLVEVVGDKVAVRADNGAKIEASHPELAVEKTGYRFVTRGSSLLLDDVTVWEVQP